MNEAPNAPGATTGTVVHLKEAPPAPPVEVLIVELERMLEAARAGTMRGLVAFEVHTDHFNRLTTGEWKYTDAFWHLTTLASAIQTAGNEKP